MLTAAKYCPGCETTKPVTEFWKYVTRYDGLQAYCKPCTEARNRERRQGNPDKVRRYKQRYRKQHLEEAKLMDRRKLLKTYGLTLEDFDELLLSQGSACAICGGLAPGGHGQWHIDHDHTIEGEVRVPRGILCSNCNLLLGHAKDSERILTSAARYLGRARALSANRS